MKKVISESQTISPSDRHTRQPIDILRQRLKIRMFKKTHAVKVIENAYLTHLERNKAAKTIQEAFHHYTWKKQNYRLNHVVWGLIHQTTDTKQVISQACEQLLSNQKHHVIDHDMTHEAIDQLHDYAQEDMKQIMTYLNDCRDGIMPRLLCIDMCLPLITKLETKLNAFLEENGYAQISGILKYKYGYRWPSALSSAKTYTQLKQLDPHFIPTRCEFRYDDMEEDEDPCLSVSMRLGLTPIEYFHGATVKVPIDDGEHTSIRIKGYFKNDALNMAELNVDLREKKQDFLVAAQFEVPDRDFINGYLQQYSTRDLYTHSEHDFIQQIKLDYTLYKDLKDKGLPSLVKDFAEAPIHRQLKMISLLLTATNGEAQRPESKDHGSIISFLISKDTVAFFLYDLILKEVPDYQDLVSSCLHFSIGRKLVDTKNKLKQISKRLKSLNADEIPYETRILMSQMNEQTKLKAIEKSKLIDKGGSEEHKARNWLNGLLKTPFGTYCPPKVTEQGNTRKEISDYLDDVQQDLDDAVHGHNKAKQAIKQIIGQWISNSSSGGGVIGLQGPPGNGKTTLAKDGIAKALGRPFTLITLGGMTDSSHLVGHDYTYVGSNWGLLVDKIMETKCMNPVILIDELDKVSQTEKGREIIGILTHLTDPSQNEHFQDKYFAGIDFDFSKALIVFTYNDPRLIDPILRDRITVIETKPLTIKEKLVVTQRHLMPTILETMGLPTDAIQLSDELTRFIIEEYTVEAGVRRLKEKLYAVCRDLNLKRLLDPDFTLPLILNKSLIIESLEAPQMDVKRIPQRPLIGTVNGLFATSAGTGGLTIIQAFKSPENKLLKLELTGSQGDVMQESMKTARTVAWNLLPEDIKETFTSRMPFGLHIHVPETSTPKDGPSAGGAITTAILSQLTGIPVRPNVATTGEIDLNGNISKIGGLEYKLNGAKKAGATHIVIPEENRPDLDQIMERDPELFSGDFRVSCVSRIEQLLEHILVPNKIRWNNPQTHSYAGPLADRSTSMQSPTMMVDEQRRSPNITLEMKESPTTKHGVSVIISVDPPQSPPGKRRALSPPDMEGDEEKENAPPPPLKPANGKKKRGLSAISHEESPRKRLKQSF